MLVRMLLTCSFFLLAAAPVVAVPAQAQAPIVFEGDVPDGPNTFFFLEFDVPEGIAEIEVVHSHVPVETENVLDWGLDDPNGSRGWGGSNQEDTVVGVEAASRNYIPGPIPAGTWRVTIGKARLVEGAPAGYLVEVTLRTTPTLEAQPRTPYQDPGAVETGARWYEGDFHVHTRESGDTRPSLTLDDAVSLARAEGLDFVMLSEHNTNSGFTLYEDVQARHPEVLILPGQEFTTYRGHANAIGALQNVPYTVGTDGYTIDEAIQAFHDQGALFSVNHPTFTFPGCRGCGWEYDVDPTTVDSVEVATTIVAAVDYYEDLIRDGSRATAIGGSDDHRGGVDLRPIDTPIGTPRTLVFADELSVAAIIEGVRSGRTVVKMTGPEAPMIESELSGERIGNTVYTDSTTFSGKVTDGEGTTLQVLKNGEVIESVPVASDEFEYAVEVEAPTEGGDRYRHQVVEGPRVQTLSSYVWLQKAADNPNADSSGGCSARLLDPAASGRAAATLLLFVAGLWLLRRRAWRRG